MDCQLIQRYMVVFLLFTSVCTSLRIIEGPTDLASAVGGDTVLTCLVEETGETDLLEWSEFITDDKGNRIWLMSVDGSIGDTSKPEKYSIEGKYNLRIKNLTVEDGGQYGCHLLLSQEDNTYKTAEVALFEPSMCFTMGEDLHEGDEAFIGCQVPFGGNIVPDMEFTTSGSDVVVDKDIGDGYVYISSNLTLTDEDDDRSYTCSVHVTQPGYMDTCSCSFNVSYSARNVTFEPMSSMYIIGDEITCKARGNPQPSVMWTQLYPGNLAINGSVLTIEPGMEGLHTWTCHAQNEIRDNVTQQQQNITFTVYTSTTPVIGEGINFLPSSILLGIMLLVGYLQQ